jgi:glycosyltransferase involved in cell wall biosynthesis
MKIAVYTIALNEEKHINRWYESVKDADYLLIADTGSNDKTVKIAKKLGINVINISINPWRFDDARNAALASLPKDIDYCISMDMDETISINWRESLEKMTADQIDYVFNVSYRDEDEKHPEDRFINNRIHKRHGFRWIYLMHEAIVADRINATTEFCKGLEVFHHPDHEKSREQYNKMVEDAYNEYKNLRYHIYHGTQLVSNNMLEEGAKVFKSLLKLKEKVSDFDKASAYRWLAQCEPNKNKKYLKKSLKIKKTRETLTELAILNYNKENWIRSYFYAKQALKITEKSTSLLRSLWAWGYIPFNILKASQYNMKLFKYSKSYKDKKKVIDVRSAITHNFKIFND